MISKISELFEVDVEELQRYLQALDSSAIELEKLLENGNYLKTEISMYTGHLRELLYRIKAIYELIEAKAEKYRPNNMPLHEFLRELDNPLRKLEMLILGKIWYDYYPTSDYIERGLYVDLEAIRGYVKDIENILRSAVQRGAFI